MLAAPDLDAGVDYVESLLGVRAVPGGSHPQWGTRNALLGLGPSQYLEIIAPDPNLPRPSGGYKFGIDDLDRPKLVTWAANATGIDAVVAHARQHGYDPGPVVDGARKRVDGSTLRWRLTMPQLELGVGVVPFLIDWGDSPHPAAALPSCGELVYLEAEHPGPDAVNAALRAMNLAIQIRTGPATKLTAAIKSVSGSVKLISG